MTIGAEHPESTPRRNRAADPQHVISRIAAGVDGFPEGRDAAVLGASLARATEAELMLVTVHASPMLPVPKEMNWRAQHQEAEAMLREVRQSLAPDARTLVESDLSIPRALHRAVRAHHRDLLVVGSSRSAPEGRVRIGKRTRQLLCHFDCALAVAPRGLHQRPATSFQRIGVGYDGEAESEKALATAGAIAAATGAELVVKCVVDDRIPILLRSALEGLVATEWKEAVAD